jgi:hypothetical protein
MCRYYSRRFLNEHTLIIQKRTAIINDYIDALIKDVERDIDNKVIFIYNVDGTTPDATCYYIGGWDLDFYQDYSIKSITNRFPAWVRNVKFSTNKNGTWGRWYVELDDADVGEMLRDTSKYFIETEYETRLTVERFRKKLLDTYPVLRYEYDTKIDYQDQVDYINEENEMLRRDRAGTVLPTPTDSD